MKLIAGGKGQRTAGNTYSLDAGMLSDILAHAKPMGHREEAATLNLGFGFLYYGFLILPELAGASVKVAPGDRVVAGETTLLE
jgi:hypothetical protein